MCGVILRKRSIRIVFLKTGLYAIGGLIIVNAIGDNFFEIRSVLLYEFLQTAESVFVVMALAFIVYGLLGSRSKWKRLLVIPLMLFLCFYMFFFLVFNWIGMPNEIQVKPDTQILYMDKDDNRRKIVIQEYWTGITGANYQADTISVYEFSPYLRFFRDVNSKDLDALRGNRVR